jgi:hypothetical protein
MAGEGTVTAGRWEVPFLKALVEAKARYDRQGKRDPALVCRVGHHFNCAVLKLQKLTWTNDDMRAMPNQTGIFFSIWITESGAKQGRADYNIHSLKVRKLNGYRITSIDFCRSFRTEFEKVNAAWPNVSTSQGPLTLMQGWFEIGGQSFAADVLSFMNHFDGKVTPIIDHLLAQRRWPIDRSLESP